MLGHPDAEQVPSDLSTQDLEHGPRPALLCRWSQKTKGREVWEGTLQRMWYFGSSFPASEMRMKDQERWGDAGSLLAPVNPVLLKWPPLLSSWLYRDPLQ